ncbi:MAG: hypothetical protein SOX50_06250 [Terrisporobacter othiniensis]|uniref:hypothetical protein n=1 Tax=Terrisporobacter othiniensis TaxID=1577792 RepID=UPI002A75FCE3|nr:hypothetical protein [Terrisporobacter othiniensis]MDY3372858.1 hypothetical protein [Terrisporobacter othiniensis]
MTRKNYFEDTSYACKCTYESFNRKLKLIRQCIEDIDNLIEGILQNRFEKSELEDKNELLCDKFANCCELMYSSMEYIGYLLYIYQIRTDMNRGNWKKAQSSFHKIINSYFNVVEREKYILFRHKDSAKIIENIGIWYYLVRNIRSKETHYNKGKVEVRNNDIFYINEVEYGEHTANEFNLNNLKGIFSKFNRDTSSLISLIDNYEIKV